MEFIQQNLLLVLMALGSGGALIAMSMRRPGGRSGVTPTQATLLINREDAQVIDVRGSDEYVSGHLPDSRNIPLEQLEARAGELELRATQNLIYDLTQYGLSFTPSPRHADMLLVTGPVSRNMEVALRRTYEATPAPKLVVAVGDCGCDGGLFGESYASCGRVANVIPVDVAVPGCPPPPIEILRGILTAVRRCRLAPG